MPPVCSGNLWSVGHPGPAGLGGTQPPVLTIAPPTWGRGQGWPGLLSLRRSHREGNRCTVGPGLWSLEDAGSNSSSPFPPGELTWTSQRCSLFIHKRANAADTRGVSNRKENAPCLVHSPVLGAWQEFIHIGPPPTSSAHKAHLGEMDCPHHTPHLAQQPLPQGSRTNSRLSGQRSWRPASPRPAGRQPEPWLPAGRLSLLGAGG